MATDLLCVRSAPHRNWWMSATPWEWAGGGMRKRPKRESNSTALSVFADNLYSQKLASDAQTIRKKLDQVLAKGSVKVWNSALSHVTS